MRGFILQLKRVRDEDLIVTTLTKNSIKEYYRFYGARHSILQLGNLIDFEEVSSNGVFLDRLKSVTHLPFSWIYQRDRLMIWHNLTINLYRHLKDSSSLDSFYFDLMLNSAKKWRRQNPKRVFCETLYQILNYEGRLYKESLCSICERPLNPDNRYIGVSKSFILSHPNCSNSFKIDRDRLKSFLDSGKTLQLEDFEVEILYKVAMMGFEIG